MDRALDFEFLRRTGVIDWGSVRSADLRLGDVTALQPVLNNLLCADLRRDDLQILADHRVVKAFRLCQLGMEVLSAMQQKLSLDIAALKATREQQQSQKATLEQTIAEYEQKVSAVETRVSQKAKALSVRSDLAAQRMSSHLLRDTMVRANALPCSHCGKLFQSEHYLHGHLQRRHPPPDTSPEEDFKVLLQQLSTSIAEQLQQTAAKHSRELQHLQSEYESKLPTEPKHTPVRHQARDSPQLVEEFLASQRSLREMLAARPSGPAPVPPPQPEEDSAWLERVDASLHSLVSTIVSRRLPAPAVTAPQADAVGASEEPALPVEPVLRFYPESTITSNAGELEDDVASPRTVAPLVSRAGEIEEDEIEKGEMVEMAEIVEEPSIGRVRTGQMTEVRKPVETMQNVCTPDSVLTSASDLGVDISSEPQCEFLVRAMLHTPVPQWRAELQGSQVLYVSESGQRSYSHPAVPLFRERLTVLRSKKWKHETRDFLLGVATHENESLKESPMSLFEHQEEEFAQTRAAMLKFLSGKTAPKKALPNIPIKEVPVSQGFKTHLTLADLKDKSEGIEESVEMREGGLVARGTVGLNDLEPT